MWKIKENFNQSEKFMPMSTVMLPTVNQSMQSTAIKDDFLYYGELIAELQQLDSLIALNQSCHRINSLPPSCVDATTKPICSQLLVKHAREILLREILIVENRLSKKVLSENAQNLMMSSFLCKCNSENKTHSSNEVADDAFLKGFEKNITISFDFEKNNAKRTNKGEDTKKNLPSTLRKRFVNKRPLDEMDFNVSKDDVFGVIIEKFTENGNYQMHCKLLLPENIDSNYNMIGRILGPRGISIRQMESRFSCRILIRGKGSIKNPEDEERLRNTLAGKHLTEKLHVLIEVEKPNHEQCLKKMNAAKAFIEQLLAKPEFDNFKRNQLIQLAIINGTYRKTNSCTGSNKTSSPPSSS